MLAWVAVGKGFNIKCDLYNLHRDVIDFMMAIEKDLFIFKEEKKKSIDLFDWKRMHWFVLDYFEFLICNQYVACGNKRKRRG